MELLFKLTPAITSTLFSIGGTGYKWVRRYLLPLLLATLLYFNGVSVWQLALTCGLMCGGLTLGYGEKTPYLIKALMIATYYLPVLFITLNGVSIVLAIMCTLISTLLFWVSNQKWGEELFPWWVVEPIIGFLIGLNILWTISYIN